jgi:hypothetical protein
MPAYSLGTEIIAELTRSKSTDTSNSRRATSRNSRLPPAEERMTYALPELAYSYSTLEPHHRADNLEDHEIIVPKIRDAIAQSGSTNSNPA